jgi:hypothetical protein
MRVCNVIAFAHCLRAPVYSDRNGHLLPEQRRKAYGANLTLAFLSSTGCQQLAVGWDIFPEGLTARRVTKSAEKPYRSGRGWIGVGRAGLNAQEPNKTPAVPEPCKAEHGACVRWHARVRLALVWTGVAGWVRVEPQGCPGEIASGRALEGSDVKRDGKRSEG